MKKHRELTKEVLSKEFFSDFELTARAIELAKREVNAGKEFVIAQFIEQLRKHPEQLKH